MLSITVAQTYIYRQTLCPMTECSVPSHVKETNILLHHSGHLGNKKAYVLFTIARMPSRVCSQTDLIQDIETSLFHYHGLKSMQAYLSGVTRSNRFIQSIRFRQFYLSNCIRKSSTKDIYKRIWRNIFNGQNLRLYQGKMLQPPFYHQNTREE